LGSFQLYLLFSTFIDTINYKEDARLIINKSIIAYCDGLDEYDGNYNYISGFFNHNDQPWIDNNPTLNQIVRYS
jgi:hypothetical protein